ncbi:dienelactone hydrolase family protein (macronuclear) [Tetrahymena thermophila SB210]|uniref:Dienelactone hydrolase family protein n=1 Tax=Tetrahymena thermophila (strain SB210) TaxID=312017 RepID=I7MIH2_TETTS|nr:dienelactone hydrolase family protein [Tetrahymena thermophila SB210]EAS04426.2 dienelactone hydrolase family protein [Tetrahymena thermophila SB210]|eukprot:XP_001024671.2 dienelactone hydrolase family protein [Tetrahymena thermophila SB210]
MEDKLSVEILTEGERNLKFLVEGRPEGLGYLKKYEGSKLGLVLIQEWWGLNQSLTITADKVAAQGFNVLVPDVYRGAVAKNREEAGHYFKDLDWSGAIQDMKGAANYLKNQLGCTKVGILGFCLGGALTFAALSATDGIFSAGAPFYGIPDQTKYPIQKIKVPVQGHFGELDQIKGMSDPETAKKLEVEAKKAGVDFNAIVWKGAEHAFMNQNSSHYNPEVAQKALLEVTNFFKNILQ